MGTNKYYVWHPGSREYACGECGWTKGQHQGRCKVAVIEELEKRVARAEAACRALMKYEYYADGDEDLTSDEKFYWPAVKLARAAVGDYDPGSEDDDGSKD